MPVLVATIIPRAGQLDAVEAVFVDLIPAFHQEDGCELYALHRGEDRLVIVEKWRDMAAHGAHESGDIVKMIGQRVEGMIAVVPDVQLLDPVPTGDEGKGAV